MRMRNWFAGASVLGVLVAGCGGDTAGSAGAPNACGGDGSLRYQDAALAPTAPCGPCGDGVIVCASPNALVCVGASPASACADASEAGRDGSADAGPRDATIAADGMVEDGAVDGRGASTADGATADASASDVSATDGGSAETSVADVVNTDVVLCFSDTIAKTRDSISSNSK